MGYNAVSCVDALCSSKFASLKRNALMVAGNYGNLSHAIAI